MQRTLHSALATASAAQLGTGLAGMALALKRRHPYDLPWMKGSRRHVARDSIVMGTALSPPVAMLALQAGATAAVARRRSPAAARVLAGLGATMVVGYLAERLTRDGLRTGAWHTAELRLAAAGTALAAAMAPLAVRAARA